MTSDLTTSRDDRDDDAPQERAEMLFELLPTGTPDPAARPLPVRARLHWTGTDPHVIKLTLLAGPGRVVRWDLGRDLLTAGIERAPVGLGDVSILPDLDHPARRELILSTPDGRACLRFHAGNLTDFLDRVTAALAGQHHAGTGR